MVELGRQLKLLRAWAYPNSPRGSRVLPVVYGLMDTGGEGGQWQVVCLDKEGGVYAVAGHRLGEDCGLRLFDARRAEIDPASYTFRPAHDYMGRGEIATVSFGKDVTELEPITARCRGIVGPSGQVLVNPVDIAVDLLTRMGGLSTDEIDPASASRAWARAEQAGYRAGGVITSPTTAAKVLTSLVGCFLGAWWVDGRGRVRLGMDIGMGWVEEGEVAGRIRWEEMKDVVVKATLEDIVNHATALYAYNFATGEYEACYEGTEAMDPRSQGLYGPRHRELKLPWVREEATARAVCTRLVEMMAMPTRVISATLVGMKWVVLEKGDGVVFCLPIVVDSQGRGLVNELGRVVEVCPQVDRGVVSVSIADSGCYLSLAWKADGSVLADGSHQAGAERDRRE